MNCLTRDPDPEASEGLDLRLCCILNFASISMWDGLALSVFRLNVPLRSFTKKSRLDLLAFILRNDRSVSLQSSRGPTEKPALLSNSLRGCRCSSDVIPGTSIPRNRFLLLVPVSMAPCCQREVLSGPGCLGSLTEKMALSPVSEFTGGRIPP